METNKGNLVQDGKVIKSLPVSFGEIELSRPDNAYVNDNRGGKSTTAIVCRVPINVVGGLVITVACNVYARLADGKIKVAPAVPKGMTLSDAARDHWKAHINDAIRNWSGRDRAFRDAVARLTAVAKPKGDAGTTTADKAADIEFDVTAFAAPQTA